ncbi:hypothetical protein MKW92_006124 [Papaver armeniacum]|nr:hypothetical protein MKW92_006124 [Papaver armeniacum]
MEPAAERKHHFFKIFHEEEQKTRLRIPVAFCQRLPTESPACECAILQGRNGASWVVQVNKTENGTYLEDGWETFVQENGLKKYDFLVFRHDGGMEFLVKVFKGNGCPREECFAPVPSPILAPETHGPKEECSAPVPSPILGPESLRPEEEYFSPVPSPILAPDIHGPKVQCFAPVLSPIPEQESHGPKEECFTPVASPIPAQESHRPKEECITPVASPIPAQESHRPKEECFTPVASPIPAQESRGPKQECLTPVASPIPAQENHRPQQEYPTSAPSPLWRGRRRHGSPYENPIRKKREMLALAREVEIKVMSFSSRFPFFWNCVKVSYKKCMNIPVKFSREHFAAKATNPISGEESMDVLLQNEEGCTWELRVMSNAYQHFFSKGYIKFFTDNNLKVGDYVIFELIDRFPDAKYLMNFYIHRVPVVVPKEECFTPVASPIPAEESHGPREEFVISVPPQLRQGRKRHGISCESSTRKWRGTVNDGKKDGLHSPHNIRLIIFVFHFSEMLASATVVKRKVLSFSSPFPFFWNCVKSPYQRHMVS